MSRVIKFRGKHKAMSELCEVAMIDYIHNEIYFDSDVGHDFDDCILEQFTGLTDNNGVDIYEGDIIKENYLDCIGRIFYHDSYCQFKFKCGLVNSVINSDVEVIGNIHQHPELLK